METKTKYIFVTGGVVSGLGKGVCAASVGYLLKARGFKVFSMKLDPYLNINPGILSPIEHGEVFVTEDGAETDLDLGYYERFIGTDLTGESSYTSGKLFQRLWEKEKENKFNGKTMQMVPHFTNEIQNVILNIGKKYKPDFAIIEIGGTVGDLESNPFFYAIAQLNHLHYNQTFFIHVSYVPFLEVSKDFKSKPTQHSIATLRSLGISPNMVFLRSDKPITNDINQKISLFSFLDQENVISIPNFDVIYQTPLYLEKKNVIATIFKHFKIKVPKINLTKWEEFTNKSKNINCKEINIAMCGKYVIFHDAYKSIIEALSIASVYENVKINFVYIDLINLSKEQIKSELAKVNSIVLLPGKGHEGWENEILCAKYGKENAIPTLGICFGMHAMVACHAREINKDTDSIEFSNDIHQNIEFFNEKIKGHDENNFNVRIGSREINIKKNSLAYSIYKKTTISERFKHKYFISNKKASEYETLHAKFTGFNNKNEIAEIFEIDNHPFYMGVQFHPEFKVRPLDPGKLFPFFLNKVKTN
ncbi:CTP synthase [Metamycoplasma buccale]|uniref:CTP synthase n=1 Tax=Metamycoplasma buccale TaxID=55602 RepID=UPI00398E9B2C